MTSPVIRTRDLTKWYGRNRGVEGLDLEVGAGEIVGYLGPNGAGKTTTIRLLLDLIRPTRGAAELFGLDVHHHGADSRRRVGYLPGGLRLYESLSGRELLDYFAGLRGQRDRALEARLAERLDLDLSREIRSLSHGTKQKVGLVAALAAAPDLLILDEPTTGLDPLMQITLFELLAEVRSEGRTVFLSSHVLPEVERACDRVAFIREGRLVAVEAIAAFKARAVRRIAVQFAEPVPADVFEGLSGVREVVEDGSTLTCAVMGSVDAIVKEAARHTVVAITSAEPSLEDLFLAHYREGTDAA